jgi:hypothetical protein
MARSTFHNAPGFKAGRGLMPTLFRFLVVIGVIVGVVYGAMWSLATFVEPRQGEMTVRVPAEKLNPKR